MMCACVCVWCRQAHPCVYIYISEGPFYNFSLNFDSLAFKQKSYIMNKVETVSINYK